MVTYVRTKSKCAGHVVTKKQGRLLKSSQSPSTDCAALETQSESGESHTQQRHAPDARSHTSLLDRPYYTQNVDKSHGPESAVLPLCF